MFKRFFLTTAALSLSVAPAFAHVSAEHASMLSGLSHPFSGADHMLAMVAVGLWAALIGGRARLVVPAAFVTMMVVGFALGQAGFALPFVEPAILASVVGLGLLVSFAVKVPTTASAAIVAVFAIFHGHAHAAESAGASALSFGLGFVTSTIVLHLAGMAAGSWLSGRNAAAARIAGGLTAVAGSALILG